MLGITEEDLCTGVVIVGTKSVLTTLGPPELAVPHSVSLPAADRALSEQRGKRNTPECRSSSLKMHLNALLRDLVSN